MQLIKQDKQKKLQILQYQTKNKLFEPKYLPNNKWEITKRQNQEADFVIEGSPYAFVFLSLKYHTQNNVKYIKEKLMAFREKEDYGIYKKRLLLLLCDVEDDKDQIFHLHSLCEEYNFVMLCGFSFEEISSYVLTFLKICEDSSLPQKYLSAKKPSFNLNISNKQ